MLNISNTGLDDETVWRTQARRARAALLKPVGSRWLGRVLLVLALALGGALFAPWQQTIPGTGGLTALRPQDRPQTVQTAIAGRIERWAVREGQLVQRGDTLLVLSELKDEYLDPELPRRLAEQLAAKRGSLQANGAKVEAANAQLAALQTGLVTQLGMARNKLAQARNQLASDSADQVAGLRFLETAQARLARYEAGYRSGLFALTDIETRRLKLQEDRAKVVAQASKVLNARQALASARLELASLQAKYAEQVAKTAADRSTAEASRAGAEGEVAALRNKLSNVAARRGWYVVRAPQTGFVVRALRAGLGETIKEGEAVATLQPEAPALAAELYVQAADVPLIQRGRRVRLQFNGWPAVQFSGWPSVAVGTFGGVVTVIDVVSSPGGKYRLLVSPLAHQPGDRPWPRQLRLGSGVYGWVLLDSVPVWYEIWRQLNGFPPSLQAEPDTYPTKSGDKDPTNSDEKAAK